jgi:hypothetical protein
MDVCMFAIGTPGLEVAVSLSEPVEDVSFPPQRDLSRFSMESSGQEQHLAVHFGANGAWQLATSSG